MSGKGKILINDFNVKFPNIKKINKKRENEKEGEQERGRMYRSRGMEEGEKERERERERKREIKTGRSTWAIAVIRTNGPTIDERYVRLEAPPHHVGD